MSVVSLRAGDIVGRWMVLQRIGEGGFGSVYEVASSAVPGRTRALKLVAESPQRSQEYQIIIRHLKRHRAIAPIVDFITPRTGAPENHLGLVMPLGSESLQDRLERLGPLQEHEVRSILGEVASALAFLHMETPASPVVHSDIKPANIIRVGNQWQLTDFGIAVVCSQAGVGNALGFTAGFDAPEVSLGIAAPAVDVYALGATLVRCLWPTRLRPSEFVTSLGSEVVGGAISLATRCLSNAPDERPTAAEFFQALDGFERDRKFSLPLAVVGLYHESRRGPRDLIVAAKVLEHVAAAGPRSASETTALSAIAQLVSGGRRDVAEFFVECLEALASRDASQAIAEKSLRPGNGLTFDVRRLCAALNGE